MSRDVKALQNEVFLTLNQRVTSDARERIRNTKQEIEISEDMFHFLRESKCYFPSKKSEMCLWTFNDHKYMSFVGDSLETMNDSRIPDDEFIVGAIGILLISKGLLKVEDLVSDIQLVDMYFGFDESNRFSVDHIFKSFENYSVYEIFDEDFELKYEEDFSRLESIIQIEMNTDLSSGLKGSLHQFLQLPSSRGVVELVNNTLQTTNNKLIFLQIYRMIEYLFIIGRALLLGERYDVGKEKLVEMLSDEELNRRAERKCLYDLLANYASNDAKEKYCSYLDSIVEKENLNEEMESGILVEHDEDAAQTAINCSNRLTDYIYKCRCCIAHYKYGQDEIVGSNSLETSNEKLMGLTVSLFSKLDSSIVEINDHFHTWEQIHFEF